MAIRHAMGLVGVCAIATTLFAQAPAGTDPTELIKEARKANSAGRQDEAIAIYGRALRVAPDSYEVHLGLGIALDLSGTYSDARQHLSRAIELGPDDSHEQTLSAMAISYAFEGNAREASTYYQRLFDEQRAAGDTDGAAATANALGRVYLESKDFDAAQRWYQTGNDIASKMANLPADQIDLWQIRWHHAQGRLAARRGRIAEARVHAAAVSELVNKSELNKQQAPAYQYLMGYIELYAGRYDAAIEELLKGDLADPFVLGLVAQSYDRKGDAPKALEYYSKVLASNAHNIQNAFSRPLARKRLAELKPSTGQ